jgi:hypothetical protein
VLCFQLLMALIGAACFFLFLSLWFAFIGVRRVTKFKIVRPTMRFRLFGKIEPFLGGLF